MPAPVARGWPKYKRMVWTGAFAAVTFVGTIYGAGLKTRMEYKEVRFPMPLTLPSMLSRTCLLTLGKQEKKLLTEAPISDRIDALETRKGQLLSQRIQIERKLQELRRKMADEPEGRDKGM